MSEKVSMFELNQIHCFVAVAEELSFRRAAIRLHMTQPPLSRQIQMLEHQVGVRLFERSTRSVALTAAGRSFLEEARKLLVLAQQASDKARRIAAGELGQLTLSFVSCSVYQYLPALIQQMQASHPDVEIHLREMSSEAQFNALRTRQVDLSIVRSTALPVGITGQPLFRESFVLAIPAENPLARQEALTLSCLEGQPFINYESSSWRPFHDMISLSLHRQGVEPKYVHSIGSTVAILSLVNGGLGLALVPESSADIRFDQVVFRRLPPVKGLSSETLLVWHEENNNPTLHLLKDTLQQCVAARQQ